MSDNVRCRWLRALGYPTGMAGLAASFGGVIWYFVGRVMPPFDFAVWLFVTEWPGLLLAVVWWDTRDLTLPEPEPRRDTVPVIDPPISNLPRRQRDFDDRFEQTHAGPGPIASWRERPQPKLPEGLTRHELIEWLFDARDGKATFAVRDSRKGEGGRSRSFSGDLSADDVTANVRAFLATYDVIEIDGSGQWDWDVMKDPLFDALLRGEGFGVLLPPTESEV